MAKRKSIELLHITPKDEPLKIIDAEVTVRDWLLLPLLNVIGLRVSKLCYLEVRPTGASSASR